ncbi:MAG: hypothetical protein H8E57_02235 [Candidatus Cloacimonetes bacterium]|nr:hypothetical protein [Candidatus Cloacimonadota bacterium]
MEIYDKSTGKLDNNAEKILVFLEKDRKPTISIITRNAQLHDFKVELYCQKLMDDDYITRDFRPGCLTQTLLGFGRKNRDSYFYELDEKGKEYLIKHKLV